jgi:hypothetical protein
MTRIPRPDDTSAGAGPADLIRGLAPAKVQMTGGTMANNSGYFFIPIEMVSATGH